MVTWTVAGKNCFVSEAFGLIIHGNKMAVGEFTNELSFAARSVINPGRLKATPSLP